jgi:hypothetical protein
MEARERRKILVSILIKVCYIGMELEYCHGNIVGVSSLFSQYFWGAEWSVKKA